MPAGYNNDTKQQMIAASVGSEVVHALNVLEDPVVIFDDEWRYYFVNEAGWRVLDRPRGEVLGQVVWELRPDLNDSIWKKAAFRSMKTQKRVEIEEYYPLSRQWYATRFYPSPHSLVAHMRNITKRKEAEQTNEQLLGPLELAMEIYWKDRNRERREKKD